MVTIYRISFYHSKTWLIKWYYQNTSSMLTVLDCLLNSLLLNRLMSSSSQLGIVGCSRGSWERRYLSRSGTVGSNCIASIGREWASISWVLDPPAVHLGSKASRGDTLLHSLLCVRVWGLTSGWAGIGSVRVFLAYLAFFLLPWVDWSGYLPPDLL